MSRTLRDRLAGRATAPESVLPAATARAGRTEGAATSGMFGWRRADGADLSPVEELKRAIHRQLIERLDLAALEALDDEAQLTLRIRQAVADLLRGETTPLSQAERETL
ncbi:MAG TPA: hypothetical protein PKE51_06430, partial [Gemmatimonadaceae bacterium]|nr:hypothetical protein [Gemmatimonadaceae bacterium]